ncbi:MAG: hypothetical protein ACLPPV_00815 [Candidatus Korobacteraceae bacterium]|jgi:hypothetical protein
MRYLLCALLFSCSLFAQNQAEASAPQPSGATAGAFYVDGIVYQYASRTDHTVVAAAHSVINHKFLAVKVRVYNAGQRSVTVKPEDILVEDVIAGHGVSAIPGAELARRMRKSYNMARFGVNAMAGSDSRDAPITSEMASPQFLQLMRAMAARANSGGDAVNNLLYTDTPGALESGEEPVHAEECDVVCRLRTREGQGADVLAQLQRQNSPDFVEQCALLANTVPPRANVAGVLYFPLGKLSESAAAPNHGKKVRVVRVTVPLGSESFQFLLPVE